MNEYALVVIPCGGKKRAVGTVAWRLYTGSQFTHGLRAALALVDRDRVRIVSGKYGLLRLTDPVLPYQQYMGDPGCVTADIIRGQATEQGISDADPVLLLLPAPYAKAVLPTWPQARDLMAELPDRRMGYQASLLRTIALTRAVPTEGSVT